MFKMELYIDGSFSAECSSEDITELTNEIDDVYRELNRPENLESVEEIEFIITKDNAPYNSFAIIFNKFSGKYELRSELA